jgi:tryptophanyl-tRNA synthetase
LYDTDQYIDLSYFEDDDEKLKKVEDGYRSGELLTGELKKMAIELIQGYVKDFQARRKEVTDDLRKQYMTPRKLEWKGNPNPKPKESKKDKAAQA